MIEKRVEILREYDLLDTLPESEFDDIVELASVFFHAPISLISLLDSHRQWFKAKVGLGASETPIEQAFCYHAIQRPQEVMVVPDSFLDERFRHNPLATSEPHVRFYAGAPLVTDEGYALGTLCVIDKEPREFSEEQKRVLRILADKVIERFESRKRNIVSKRQIAATDIELKLALNRLLEAEKIAKIGNWDINVGTQEIYWSPEMYRLYGLTEDANDPITFAKWRMMVNPDDLLTLAQAQEVLATTGQALVHEFRTVRERGGERWLLSTVESSENNHLIGTTLDITERKKAEESRKQYTVALEQMLFALSHKVRKPAANVLGIVKTLERDKVTEADIKECLPFLRTAADELDGYIHELNDFINDHKTEINSTELG